MDKLYMGLAIFSRSTGTNVIRLLLEGVVLIELELVCKVDMKKHIYT